jgi:hypothetical protein
MKKYSVLLLYPECVNDSGCETYFAHVWAKTPSYAVTAAKEEAGRGNGYEPDLSAQFIPLLVIEGHHDAL